MVDPKKNYFLLITLAVLLVGLFLSPSAIFAAQRNGYYDFGPYYNQPQVLGLTFSSLENLPAPKLPEGIIPPPATGIMPGNPFYILEKGIEGIQLTFTFDPIKKEELRLQLAQERLSEAKTLITQGKTEAALLAMDDYGQAVSEVTQTLSKLAQANHPEFQNLAERVEERLTAQAVFTQNEILTSPPAQAESWSAASEATSKALDKAAEAKGDPPIPEELSTSIQRLKEQGLISEEESNKLYSLENRSEVREELDKLSSAGQFPPSELTKLDTAIAGRYPEIQDQYTANLQVAELRTYQTLTQPSEEVLKEMEKWQEDPSQTPSNDIKPYLWYNRAQDLAKAVTDNPTYTPAPSPSPTAAPSPTPADQSASPSPAASPAPTPSPPPLDPYLGETGGVLPGDPTYFIKRLGEQFSQALAFDSSAKARLSMQYAERRLAEAAALTNDPTKAALYESTLKDYQQVLTDASNYLKNIDKSIENRELAKRFESQAGRHEAILEKGLLTSQDPKFTTDAIKAAEDVMDRSADVQNKPALPQVLATRLGDLKAQGLILPEEADDLTRSSSREEVRTKIRELVEIGTFPLSDAKKLDEAQLLISPTDYNQLTEVRKIEELQNLRSVQTDLAQTPTLKNSADVLSQREKSLTQSIDTSLIKPEDLTGREDLKAVYDKLATNVSVRPINRGQFGDQPPPPTDAVLTACPLGATFKQNEGCVWADSGKKINDYDQYRCSGAGQYYSFAARKCLPNQRGGGFRDDASPVCPAGYNWVWQSQSCQTSTSGVTPLPTPDPGDSNSCPQGSSYQSPNGCVWDNNGKKVADSTDYSCGRNQYYSFSQFKCVPYPKPGEVGPNDFTPSCKDPNAYWSWSDGKCAWPRPIEGGIKEINIPQPTFVPPGNPLYFVKQWGEGLQRTFVFTPQAREQVSLSQAKERLAEAAYALKKDDKAGVKAAITAYISTMQNLVADVPREGLSEGAKQEIAKRLSDGSVEQNLMLQKLSAWAKEEEDDLIQAAASTPILGVDKASDILGDLPIPEDIKAKIETLPSEMISEENKKKLLEADSRVAARIELINLSAAGGLGKDDVAFLNDDFNKVDSGAQVELEELSKLAEIADITDQKEQIAEKVEKNEDIVTKLDEFQKTFEPGQDIPAEIRPYVRLTRINEISQTIRPDLVRLDDFQNRKDVVLAVATLQEEFRPTKEAFRQVEEFRRKNPNIPLPLELARVEALSYGLGVREQAGSCFLPTPLFPANTPCPAPGAAIPITSFTGFRGGPGAIIVDEFRPGWPGSNTSVAPSLDKDGKPLVYGQGPTPASTGICPEGYHWMYDSGGWCMSNGGNYSSSYNYTPTGTGPGYTPYSPYYTAPGVPPTTYGYPAGGNSYPPASFINTYSPPSYYGTAPTYYTTNPPAGTVPGSGPAPTAPGSCPSGFHWMSDSGGWCMSNGNTYVPGGTTPTGSYSPNLNQSSCGPGYYWDGGGCRSNYSALVDPYGSTGPSSPSSYEYGCTPGYYWNGSKCVAGNNEGGNWSDAAARSGSWCQPPSSGCGSNSYWDYGSCSCRGASTYSGGGGSSSSGSSCSPPAGGCGSGWFDSSSCSCKQASSQGCYNVSASSCGSGFYWDSSACTCRSSGSATSTSGSSSSSSGSCPSGYHWMSDNGGWCMSDGGGGSSPATSPAPASSPTPAASSAPAPASEPAPAQPASTTESAPAPTTSEPAPATQPAPAPAP